MSDQIAGGELGGSGLAGSLISTPPTVTVTAPVGPQPTETVTVTWTYSSPASKPQASYRVFIRNQAGTATLFDSGTLPGTDLSYVCPFALSAGSAYTAVVTASDGFDSGTGTSAFSSALSTRADYVDDLEPTVGAVYEVAINGVGYMLSDSKEVPYRRAVGLLQPDRFATGQTPFSEAVERYSFVGNGDWSRGAGQIAYDRESSVSSAFSDSENVNPFEPGRLSLLPTTNVQVSSSLSALGAVVASGKLFVWSDTNVLSELSEIDGAASDVTFTGDTISKLCSDGTRWYVANTDEEIFRGTGTTAGSVWGDLSAQTSAIDVMEWISDRVAVAYVNGSGQACFSTLTSAGVEETTGGRFRHPDSEITAITAGDGHVWYSVNRDDRSAVYAWQLGNEDDASFVAFEPPAGESVTALFFYAGNVMVRTAVVVDATTTLARIYRAIPSGGELTPERVATLETSGVDRSAGRFAGLDRFVFWSWREMSDDGRSGVGALDLSTGGWCRWLQAPTVSDDGAVDDLFAWKNRLGFTVGGTGAALETTTPSASGYLTSSAYDMNSTLLKLIDEVTVVTEPLPINSSVTVDFSFDDGVSFSEIGSVLLPGLLEGEWAVSRTARTFLTKLVLATTGEVSPAVNLLQTKLHPISIADRTVELPINCADRMQGLNGVEIQDNQPSGMARARVLESLVGSRVEFQDIDWRQTGVSEVYEMVAAQTQTAGLFNRRTGTREEVAPVCVVTLRGPQ